MSRNNYYKSSIKLPQNAQDFIDLIIKSMRYRKKIRLEVQRELAAHFEDELRDCTDDKQKEDRAEQLIEQFGDAKLLGILLRRAKKRCRPLWRTVAARTFQTIGVFILCIIFYAFYISMGRPTVNIDYLQKATNMVRPLADESQNAANLYNQAIAIYVKPPEIAKDSLQFTDSNEPKDDLLIVISKKNSVDELTETEFELLNKWINENSEAIDLYIQASKKPYCWWNRQFDNEKESFFDMVFPELSPIRQISRLVLWRSRLNFYQGDIDGAFEDLFTLYRTGGLFKGPRMLIEQLVGIAIQAMAVHNAFEIIDRQQIGEQMLGRIQNEFQMLVDNGIFHINFKVEMFYVMDFIQRAYTDNGRGSGHMAPIGLQQYFTDPTSDSSYFFALGASLISPNRAKMTEMVEYLYDSYDKLAQFTPFSRRQMNIDTELDIDQWPRIKQARYWFFMIMVPSYNQVLRLSYRIQADSEALLTVLALQRYKLRYGQYPETLDALVQAKLLDKIPIDPFSDKAFVYRVIGEDFILYSVGQNFTDDGGQIYRDREGKARLWADEGDAVFWPVQK
ncbi:MAG: hypothetical protein WCZ89_02170 [Phycisphaerae bacterium]